VRDTIEASALSLGDVRGREDGGEGGGMREEALGEVELLRPVRCH
jgi:hypothetical protein